MMIEKIDEFYLQSNKECGDFSGSITVFDYRKFAELIVKECIKVCLEQRNPSILNYKPSETFANAIKEHFGVE